MLWPLLHFQNYACKFTEVDGFPCGSCAGACWSPMLGWLMKVMCWTLLNLKPFCLYCCFLNKFARLRYLGSSCWRSFHGWKRYAVNPGRFWILLIVLIFLMVCFQALKILNFFFLRYIFCLVITILFFEIMLMLYTYFCKWVLQLKKGTSHVLMLKAIVTFLAPNRICL